MKNKVLLFTAAVMLLLMFALFASDMRGASIVLSETDKINTGPTDDLSMPKATIDNGGYVPDRDDAHENIMRLEYTEAKEVLFNKSADVFDRNSAYNRISELNKASDTLPKMIQEFPKEQPIMRGFIIQYLQDIHQGKINEEQKKSIVDFLVTHYATEKEPDNKARILLSLGYNDPAAALLICQNTFLRYKEKPFSVDESELATSITVMAMIKNDSEHDLIYSFATSNIEESVKVAAIYALGELGLRGSDEVNAIKKLLTCGIYRIYNASKIALEKQKSFSL